MCMCDISRCISRTWKQLVAVSVTASAVLYEQQGGIKRVFFGQLNSWSCKYAASQQCCSQPSPAPFAVAFAAAEDFACVANHKVFWRRDHTSQDLLGTWKEDFFKFLSWSDRKAARLNWDVQFNKTIRIVCLLFLQRVILSKCNFKVPNFSRRLWDKFVCFFCFTVNINKGKWNSNNLYCWPLEKCLNYLNTNIKRIFFSSCRQVSLDNLKRCQGNSVFFWLISWLDYFLFVICFLLLFLFQKVSC